MLITFLKYMQIAQAHRERGLKMMWFLILFIRGAIPSGKLSLNLLHRTRAPRDRLVALVPHQLLDMCSIWDAVNALKTPNTDPSVHLTWSFSLFEVRIMEATTSGRVSLGRLSNRRLNLATTGTDMSNIPNSYTHIMTSYWISLTHTHTHLWHP